MKSIHPLFFTAMLTISIVLLSACSATSVGTQSGDLGEAATQEQMLSSLKKPGRIIFEKHLAATWAVDLSGLLNLEHPKAIAAGIEDKMESIEIYVYTVTHPEHGTYIIDSGMSESMKQPTENPDLSSLVIAAMNIDQLSVKKTTAALNREIDGGIKGVFLTHIHMDHIMGLTDIDSSIPVYIGPGDASMSGLLNALTQGTTNSLLKTVSVLNEWQYGSGGVIDIFGDGSLWAIHSPGHTPGATAYLANTTKGVELMLGDATHTKWGWENGVEPGSYSADIPTSAKSLATLKKLAASAENIKVHPGHQSL